MAAGLRQRTPRAPAWAPPGGRAVLAALLLSLACCADAAREVGSECVDQLTSRAGACTLMADCPWAQQQVENWRQPTICEWRPGRVAVVCCPRTATPSKKTTQADRCAAASALSGRTTAGRVASRKCEEYVKYTSKEVPEPTLLPGKPRMVTVDMCFRPQGKELVVGGNRSLPTEFPHAARIGYGQDESKIEYKCGGSLISPDFILTAAHCLALRGGERASWVLLGDLDTSTDRDDAQPQLMAVQERIPHPCYQKPQNYWDVALLRLARPAAFDEYVRPACLHARRDATLPDGVPDGESPVAVGWGATDSEATEASSFLMKVDLPLVPHKTCNDSYRITVGRNLPRGILDDNQLCAGHREGGKDSCVGDSGGPLSFFTAAKPLYCMYHIIGVTSFGRGCAEARTPGVYARVSAAAGWIESIVWPDEEPGN